jgi:hypothetical protein
MTSTDTISNDATSTPSAVSDSTQVSVTTDATTTTPSEASEGASAPTGVAASASSDTSSDDAEGEGEGGEGEGEGGDSADASGAPGAGSPDKPKKKRRRKKKRPGTGPANPNAEAREGGASRQQHHRASDRAPFHTGEEVFGKVTAVLETAIMVDLSGKALAIFDRNEMEPDDLVPAVGDRFVARVHNDGVRGGLVVLTRKPLREEEAKTAH